MKMKNFEPIIEVVDDGLIIPEVGSWSEIKLKLFGYYCDIFTTSMRNNWDYLIYIDLFSGTGYCKIRGSNKIIMGSPLIALAIPIKFDKYIFCEKESKNFDSLSKRLKSNYHDNNYEIINGHCNSKINDIFSLIPKPSKTSTVLTFCFADPFSLNLHFKTIRKLSEKYVDFLIHISDMDAKLNRHNYLKDKSKKIELFLEQQSWRDSYKNNENFLLFLYEEYTKNMKALNYHEPPNMPQIRSDQKNLGLYHLAFYSRSERGIELWKKIQKYSISQQSLGF